MLPRTPGMPISPANVMTQGRNAPVIMMAPAARPLSPTAPRQLRSALDRVVAAVRAWRPDGVHGLVNHAWHLSCGRSDGSGGWIVGWPAQVVALAAPRGQARPAPASGVT